MSFNITLGWWLLPLSVTVVAAGWALTPRNTDRRTGDWDFAFWIPAAFRLVTAIIVSLVAWLIWSLAR